MYLGPLIFSTDVTHQTYEWVFNSIRSNLNEPITEIALDKNSLYFGSDKEKAIVEALLS